MMLLAVSRRSGAGVGLSTMGFRGRGIDIFEIIESNQCMQEIMLPSALQLRQNQERRELVISTS